MERRTFIQWVKNPFPLIMPDAERAYKELMIIAKRKDMEIKCVILPYPNFKECKQRKLQGKTLVNLLLQQN